MRIGFYFDMRNPPGWRRSWTELYAGTCDLIGAAKEMGARSAWFSEHHVFDDRYLSKPLMLLAAVASRTSRIRLGRYLRCCTH